MDGWVQMLDRLIAGHEHARDAIAEYLNMIERMNVPSGASFPLRLFANGRYETRDEAIARAQRHLDLEKDALAAYVAARDQLRKDQRQLHQP